MRYPFTAYVDRDCRDRCGGVCPAPAPAIMQDYEKNFSRWSLTTAEENVDSVLTLQRDLGMDQHNAALQRYPASWEHGNVPLRLYMCGVTTVQPNLLEKLTRRSFWELRIAWWKMRGMLDRTSPSLSIGPRWVTEIEFFRKVVGLKGHIGLDLFSDNEDLVKVGDMHQIPFPDRHFQLIFIKNTVDKSYEVRRLVAELLRVTRSGGIVIVDQICGYGDCSPLTRTDIQKSDNLLRLFRAHSPVQVLVQQDIALINAHSIKVRDRSNNNARLAIRLPV